jgi:hypothetical protein
MGCLECSGKRYLEIARELGWIEGVAPTAEQCHTEDDKATGSSEDSWGQGSNGGNGGGGMGTSVSAMALPPLDEQDAKSLHGLAVANNVSGLSSYIDSRPGVDINELDKHVRLSCFRIYCLVESTLQGYTALHLACDRGNAVVVELLLGRGADCSLKVRKSAVVRWNN